MFLAHGLLKLVVFGPAGFEAFLAARSVPTFLAWPIIAGEIVCGAMILLGLFARLASVALLPILLGALVVHWQNGWLFSAAGGGWEYPAFLVVASLAHIVGGDGAASLGAYSRETARRSAAAYRGREHDHA